MTHNNNIIALIAFTFHLVRAHSSMSYPESISPNYCRLGGGKFGDLRCPGPCDLSRYQGKNPPTVNYYPGGPVAAVYKRNQLVTVKYKRNNHGPGGFNRFTLVTVEDMMNKAVHKRNAFHYSCWGANPVVAKSNELGRDKWGFTLIGNDGEEHNYPKGYYTSDIKIPTVVPDGKYILGWLWTGGCDGKILGNEPQEPQPWPYFSDYWSCSYIEIRGGPITDSYTPVFNNDMSQFSKVGCMSHTTQSGQCSFEPCTIENRKAEKCFYRKPAPFENGEPAPLTPDMFGGTKRGE